MLATTFKEGVSPEEMLDKEAKLMEILGDISLTSRQLEKKILPIMTSDHIKLVPMLVRNRFAIYFCSKFHQAQNNNDKKAVMSMLQALARDSEEIKIVHQAILQELSGEA